MNKSDHQAVDLYLEIVKLALTGALSEDNDQVLGGRGKEGSRKRRAANRLADLARPFGIEIARKHPYDAAMRARGLDRPGRAESMIGLQRMDNIRSCVESVLRRDVPGDLIETGVWRGGASIYMRAVLKAHGDTSRSVWLADSFQGLPVPDVARYPADAGDGHHLVSELSVGVEQVKHNFRRYGLLDSQVEFLVGWFKDTLTNAPIERVAVMRLDGDMYESTIQSLEALYPRLSTGGYCIIDDYGLLPGARKAVHDYRESMQITDEIVGIDGVGVFWCKTGPHIDDSSSASRAADSLVGGALRGAR